MANECGRISQGAVGSVSGCARRAIAVIRRGDWRLLFKSAVRRGQMRAPPVRQRTGRRLGNDPEEGRVAMLDVQAAA